MIFFVQNPPKKSKKIGTTSGATIIGCVCLVCVPFVCENVCVVQFFQKTSIIYSEKIQKENIFSESYFVFVFLCVIFVGEWYYWCGVITFPFF